ncbi:DUF5677 domain-containing protein [Sporosarcina ureae]|uniref:DUF5677 domain-containing protein n=1 Tax=Sporosarcina ureae TaxID=1571 RepID=UPI0009DC5500|nr:DUF5677 domain-containing protein [Sporosarcina ureae]ARF16730.1 hypothetical protein SporoP17a_05145 [Sporosarcina ureae]
MINGLPGDKQKKIFDIISDIVDPTILAPLTIVYRRNKNKVINEYFYDESQTVEYRIEKLQETVERFFDQQSNDSTDLRYLSICLSLFRGKVKFLEEVSMTIDAFKNYSSTSHEDEIMRLYRPMIRSFEGIDIEEPNHDFVSSFWNELGLSTECSPFFIKHMKNQLDSGEFLQDTQKAFEYINLVYKEKLLESPKFNVLMGSAVYILKLCKETLDNELENAILGRHALRTITEVFVMMKYLIMKETGNINIFKEYQLYGIGKYKHILLRGRESGFSRESQIQEPIIEAIVNEPIWEEFMDIDVRYFDQQSIKKKFEEVDESELYEIYYEYGTNFSHGFWGAVRESSMLVCNNPLHKYHTVPDIHLHQKLPSVISDIVKILKRYIQLLSGIYEFPKWYKLKYEDIQYGV